MAQLKRTLIVSIFILSMLFNGIVNAQSVKAKESTAFNVDVVIPINYLDLSSLIKQQVLDSISKQDPTFILENVDIDKTTVSLLEQIDITKVSHLNTSILVNLVNKPNTPALIPPCLNIHLNVDIVDITAPELVLTKDMINVKLNDQFDPWQFVEYAYDNSKEYPTVAIINNVDTSTLGSYDVVYAASDASGNRYSTILKVNVSNKASDSSYAVYNSSDINYMLDLINAERAKRDLEPLALADQNGQAAVGLRVSEAASFLSHTRPDGTHYKTALDQMGAKYVHSPLEVLTYSGSSVEDKLNWWMHSPNHSAILMSKGYDTIAIAYSGKMWCAIVY